LLEAELELEFRILGRGGGVPPGGGEKVVFLVQAEPLAEPPEEAAADDIGGWCDRRLAGSGNSGLRGRFCICRCGYRLFADGRWRSRLGEGVGLAGERKQKQGSDGEQAETCSDRWAGTLHLRKQNFRRQRTDKGDKTFQ
jgi:hypothetical protein